MGVLMATIDSSIVNISLPTLVATFNTDFAAVQWVVLSYILVVTSLMLGAARLGDMTNKKRLYLGGLILFTVGSYLCAQSTSIHMLIGFRALQGLGATFTQALGIAIVTQVFPSRERGRALGIIGSIVSVGIALGPALGGLIISLANWNWIFLVNIPVGLVALGMVIKFIPDLEPINHDQRFDYWGALLMLVTLGSFALGLTLAQQTGFGEIQVQGLLITAGIGLIVFILIETHADQPMIDLSLFKNVLFDMNLIMAFLVAIVMAGLFIIPFYLELVQGYAPTLVGALMIVQPIAMGLIAPLAGGLSDRFGSRLISVVGLISVSLGALAISTLREGQTPFDFAIRVIPIGVGMGLFVSPNNSAIMGAVSKERLGITSGLSALARTLGQTTGVPLIGTLFTTQVLIAGGLTIGSDVTQAVPQALVVGIHHTFQIAAVVVFTSMLIALAALWLDRRQKISLKHSTDSVTPSTQPWRKVREKK